jgi:hypothetical protein
MPKPQPAFEFPLGEFITTDDERRVVVKSLMDLDRRFTTRPTGVRASEVEAVRALLAHARRPAPHYHFDSPGWECPDCGWTPTL